MDGQQWTGAKSYLWPRTVPLRFWTTNIQLLPCSPPGGPPLPHRPTPTALPGAIRGARGPERGGPTRSHPEPGRDPPQRRRVLWGCPTGGEAAASPPECAAGMQNVNVNESDRVDDAVVLFYFAFQISSDTEVTIFRVLNQRRPSLT